MSDLKSLLKEPPKHNKETHEEDYYHNDFESEGYISPKANNQFVADTYNYNEDFENETPKNVPIIKENLQKVKSQPDFLSKPQNLINKSLNINKTPSPLKRKLSVMDMKSKFSKFNEKYQKTPIFFYRCCVETSSSEI